MNKQKIIFGQKKKNDNLNFKSNLNLKYKLFNFLNQINLL